MLPPTGLLRSLLLCPTSSPHMFSVFPFLVPITFSFSTFTALPTTNCLSFHLNNSRNRLLAANFSSSIPTRAEAQQFQKNDKAKETPDAESSSKSSSHLESGLYLVATPIGNLEDITLRALRILKSADVILSEDTRHSRKLLQHYNIETPLLSYHKFNELQRETAILRRLHEGQIVAVISDAGTPGISDPGVQLAKRCADENIRVIPIPGPSALVAALSASGLSSEEFTFVGKPFCSTVGFLPKHGSSRKEKLTISASRTSTQIFYVPPHKLHEFLEEASSVFGYTRSCVIAREITKVHEEFWRGTLGEAKKVLLDKQPRGEITLLIEGNPNAAPEMPTEAELEIELEQFVSKGHSISTAVKLVSEGKSVKRKQVYTIALRKFGKKGGGKLALPVLDKQDLPRSTISHTLRSVQVVNV